MYWWLCAHPEVCGSKTKETHFFDDEIYPRFNQHANVHQHDLSRYEAYFEHCTTQGIRLEATPIYMYQQTALKHLSKFNPKPKVLFILREPSQRAHSQFRFNKYRLGNIDPSVTYLDYLKDLAGTTSDPVQRGHYVQYIDQWMAAFGQENIHVLQLEALFANRVETMKSVAKFLALDPTFYDTFDFMKRNETRKMRSTKLHRLGLKLQPLVPQAIQEKLLVPLYLKLNSTAMPAVSSQDKLMIEEMKPLFAESNEQLKQRFPELNMELW